MLPGDDGYTIFGKLKSSPDTKSIPVIMVTAKEAEYDKVMRCTEEALPIHWDIQ